MKPWYDGYWIQYVMQNVLPPSFWTLTGFCLGYWRLHRHVTRKHEELKQHITERTGQ